MGRDKMPKPETKELWFDKIKGYQALEIEESFEKMKGTLDNIPFNLPKALKQAVFEVNRAKAAPTNQWKNYGPCEGCNGSGAFIVLMYSKCGSPYTPIQYCSQCDNWLNYCNSPGMRISANELAGAGYHFKPYNKVLMISPVQATGVGSVEKLKEMAVNSLKRME